MAMQEVPFTDEKELHTWVSENMATFLPGTRYLSGIHIWTVSGKRGLPDGFGVNFQAGSWYILESELLTHGVWPHIAEQLTRYVVATQNAETRRKIRDHIFETILEEGLEEEICRMLKTSPNRLHQKLEVFIEGIDPEVVIFIDETNRDLYDMAHALSAQIKIFRIKKYLVNGKIEYHSPDQNKPTLETEPSMETGVEISEYDVLDELGGGELIFTDVRFRVYELKDGRKIHVKRSKFHQEKNNYWYSISVKAWQSIIDHDISRLVLVMGEEGFVFIPISIVEDFLTDTSTTKDRDGNVTHYHLLISPGPNPELYYYQDGPKIELDDYYHLI